MHLTLAKHCYISTGYYRSILIDTKTSNHYHLPNNLTACIIQEGNIENNATDFRIKSNYNELLNFFVRKKLILRSQNKPPVKNLKTKLLNDHKYILNTLSFDFNVKSFKQLQKQCDLKKIKHLDIYLSNENQLFNFNKFQHDYSVTLHLPKTNSSIIKTAKWLLGQSNYWHSESSFTLHNSNIKATKQPVQPLKSNFNLDYSIIDLEPETNSYNYKRIHLTTNGDIKLNSAHIKTVGSIFIGDLAELLQQQAIQTYWHIPKTAIDVCCDCEFKAICIDRRPLSQRGKEHWYSEEECFYNPYIGLQQSDPKHLSLKECGIESTCAGFKFYIDDFLAVKRKIWKEKQTNFFKE